MFTITHNSLYKKDYINVIGAKVVIHFDIPIGDITFCVPNLSKLNLPNYTVAHLRRQ